MEKYNDTIDLRRFWRAVKQLRWLYLAAAVLFGVAAAIYVCSKLPVVPIVGQMLIGEESLDTSDGAQLAAKGAGGVSQMLKTFSVGGFGAAAVDNEVLILGSHEVLKNTVKALNLNRTYVGKTPGGKKKMLYRDMPVTVEAPAEYFDTLSVAYTVSIELLDGGKADVKVKKGFFKRLVVEALGVTLPAVVKSPLGNIRIHRTDLFETSPYKEVTVSVTGNNLAATNLYSQVEIDVASKLSDIIQLDLDYPDAELGKAIIDGIMAEYNAMRLGRLHETAENTIKYYDERLAETLGNLEKAEKKVADYRQDNSMVAPEAEAGGLLSLSQEQKLQAMNAGNQLDYYNKVISTLKSNLNGDHLIPQVEMLGDANIEEYNKLIIRRRDLERSATPENPKVILINERLSTLRDLIIENFEKSAAKARKDIGFQLGVAGTAGSRLNRYPGMELELSSLSRDRNFQSALYQFLVQSRENAVLKMYADTDVGYVFQPAYVDKAGFPVKRVLFVLAAMLLGVLCVTFVALVSMWRSRTVRQPMDVAFMGIERNAVGGKNASDSLLKMRTKLMADNVKVIYTADFTDAGHIAEKLLDTFTKTGASVESLSVEDNSALLSPDTAHAIADAVDAGAYVFAKVPSPKKLFEIENMVEKDNAVLLVIVPESMRRSEHKKQLRGQTASKVFTLIA